MPTARSRRSRAPSPASGRCRTTLRPEIRRMILNRDPPPSTRRTPSWTSLRAGLARLAWEERRAVLASLPLPLRRYLHDGWFGQGGLHQRAPDADGPWHTWLILGG